MKRKTLILFMIAFIAGILLIGLFIPKKDIVKKIECLRKKTSEELDSFNNKQEHEYHFFDSLENYISSNKLNKADSIINKLLANSPNSEQLHFYKGKIFSARQKDDSALMEYNFVILKNPYSKAREQRAIIFTKVKKYNNAIQDYRILYEYNWDYSQNLAKVFELNKQKDSALKYFYLYLDTHHKDSNLIYQEIKLLKKK